PQGPHAHGALTGLQAGWQTTRLRERRRKRENLGLGWKAGVASVARAYQFRAIGGLSSEWRTCGIGKLGRRDPDLGPGVESRERHAEGNSQSNAGCGVQSRWDTARRGQWQSNGLCVELKESAKASPSAHTRLAGLERGVSSGRQTPRHGGRE